jgi:hypothetical protein
MLLSLVYFVLRRLHHALVPSDRGLEREALLRSTIPEWEAPNARPRRGICGNLWKPSTSGVEKPVETLDLGFRPGHSAK